MFDHEIADIRLNISLLQSYKILLNLLTATAYS